MRLVSMSVDILDVIFNPIYGCGVNVALHINPVCDGTWRFCPDNSKKVPFVV